MATKKTAAKGTCVSKDPNQYASSTIKGKGDTKKQDVKKAMKNEGFKKKK